MHQCCIIISMVLRLDSSQRRALRSDRMSGSKLWRKFLQKNSPYPLHHSLSPRELELDNERRLKLADNILRPYVGTSCDTTIGNTTVRVHHFSHYFPLLFLHFYHLNHKKSYLLIKLPCLWSYDIIHKAPTLLIAIMTHSL